MLTPDYPTILIADDEPNICRIAKLIIPDTKYNVITAENGHDAFEKVLRYSPDIIFSDILMPKCDGFEFCEKVKLNQTTSHIPFIFLGCLNEKEIRARMIAYNADGFLTKPFTTKSLIDIVHSFVKPTLISGSTSMVVSKKSSGAHPFGFGYSALDMAFPEGISAPSFIVLNGLVQQCARPITHAFVKDAIHREQPTLLMSFAPVNTPLNELMGISSQDSRYVDVCDASSVTGLHQKPWRNIHYIHDFLVEKCEETPYQRLVFDSFSLGFPYWSIKDVIIFVDLCRSLPNAQNQTILWTMDHHVSIDTYRYYMFQLMDIAIQVSLDENRQSRTEVLFSKWQDIYPSHQSALPDKSSAESLSFTTNN